MLFKYIISTCMLIAIIVIAKPSYFYLKAFLAQNLLELSWEKSKNKNQIIYPWIGAKTYPIGKISIKKIDLSYIILGGEIKQSLNFGVAHIENTSKPGSNGNIGLAGHRDSFFKKLEKIHIGDIIRIESFSKSKDFKVTDIQIISPNELHWLNQSDEDILTLVTCYPFDFFGDAPKRYLVRAKAN